MRQFRATEKYASVEVMIPPSCVVKLERLGEDSFSLLIDGVSKGAKSILVGDTLTITLPVMEVDDTARIVRS